MEFRRISCQTGRFFLIGLHVIRESDLTATFDRFKRFRTAGANRCTTKASHSLCQDPHRLFLVHDTTAFVFWLIHLRGEEFVRTFAARRSRQTLLVLLFKGVKKRLFHMLQTSPQVLIRKLALSWISTSPWVTAFEQPLWVQQVAANHLDMNALDNATAFPVAYERFIGKFLIFTSSVGLASWQQLHIVWFSRTMCSTQFFEPRYDVT